MRAVVQRVARASVTVDEDIVGSIGRGLLVLLGVAAGDGQAEIDWMANKLAGLRIFPDDEGKMNLSLLDEDLEMLVVSQFTLYGDCNKGRRPSFVKAAPPEHAKPMYEAFCDALRVRGVRHVAQGRFQAKMAVELLNDGPVTLVLERP